MGNRKCRTVRTTKYGLRRMLGNQKGELLVEALVSFVILLIVLSGVGLLLKSSLSMNRDAALLTSTIEEAATEIQLDGGTMEGTSGKLLITLGGTALDPIPVVYKQSGSIDFFTPDEE